MGLPFGVHIPMRQGVDRAGSRFREFSCTRSMRNSESGSLILRSVSSFTSPNNCWGVSSLVVYSQMRCLEGYLHRGTCTGVLAQKGTCTEGYLHSRP